VLNVPSIIMVEFGGLAVLGKTERCSGCGYHIGRERAVFSTKDKPHYRLSLFASSDGFHVANARFRDLAIKSGFEGVEFELLENGYFVIKVSRLVEYDLTKAWVNQEGWCPVCKNFRRNLTLLGSHSLADSEVPLKPLEIVESRQRWGDEVGLHTAQGPDLIAGSDAAKIIAEAGFKKVEVCELGSVKRR
jgi:hypothetical protein